MILFSWHLLWKIQTPLCLWAATTELLFEIKYELKNGTSSTNEELGTLTFELNYCTVQSEIIKVRELEPNGLHGTFERAENKLRKRSKRIDKKWTAVHSKRCSSGSTVGHALLAIDAEPNAEPEESEATQQRDGRQHNGHDRYHCEPPWRVRRRTCTEKLRWAIYFPYWEYRSSTWLAMLTRINNNVYIEQTYL